MTRDSNERSKRMKFDRDREAYDRQNKETDRQWEAFIIYRDMGSSRTLRVTAEVYRETHGLTSLIASTERTVQMWSVRWHWRDRCAAWDRTKDRHRRRAALEDVAKMRDRHIKLSTSVQSLAASELAKWLKETKKNKKITIEVGDLLRVLEAGVKLERISRGEPDTIQEQRQEMDSDEKRSSLAGLLKSPTAMKALDELMDEAEKTEESDDSDAFEEPTETEA